MSVSSGQPAFVFCSYTAKICKKIRSLDCHLCVWSHVTTPELRHESLFLILGRFPKIYRRIPVLVEVGQRRWAADRGTLMRLWTHLERNSVNNYRSGNIWRKSCREKWNILCPCAVFVSLTALSVKKREPKAGVLPDTEHWRVNTAVVISEKLPRNTGFAKRNATLGELYVIVTL